METVWSRVFFFASLHLVNLNLLKSKQSQMIGKLPKTRYSKLFVLILNSMAFWCKKDQRCGLDMNPTESESKVEIV